MCLPSGENTTQPTAPEVLLAKAEEDIILHRQVWEQGVLLKDHAHAAATELAVDGVQRGSANVPLNAREVLPDAAAAYLVRPQSQ